MLSILMWDIFFKAFQDICNITKLFKEIIDHNKMKICYGTKIDSKRNNLRYFNAFLDIKVSQIWFKEIIYNNKTPILMELK